RNMSFILDSIKKAERERKLGQEVPSISIEYTGEHVGPGRANWQQWAMLLLGLIITAIVVGATTYHFANRGHEIVHLSTETPDKEIVQNVHEEKKVNLNKQNFAIVPMKNVHQSDLKTVKVISEEDRIYQPQVETVIANAKYESSSIVESTEDNIKTSKITAKAKKPKLLYELEPVVVKENNKQEAKQEIAEIYSDLAKLTPKNEPVVHEVNEQLVEIEPANYVVEDKILPKSKVSHVEPKTAVSTGLPSFGELPYDVQERIPNFNVSVHMFHADPNQRRIRINGNMYTEGKKLQQDLALVEITRYGAVFDYQGHLFRYNVR
ncbi:MAG: general secretion pathway protein GspB, partial [Pseudomonadota bacterium]